MAKFSFAKATVLALASMCASAAVVGCSTGSDVNKVPGRSVGDVGLNLTIAPGVDVNEVTFTVTGNGITPITNKIPVATLGSTISAVIGGIPAGSGYNISLNAKSVDGKTDCLGSAPFSVIAGQTTSVSVTMQCRGPVTTGGVILNGGVNNCPTLNSLVVFPLQVPAGGKISVFSSASDVDSGTTITTAWTATGGMFDAPAAPSTSFNCSVNGKQTLTVTVSDGTAACNSTGTVEVTCLTGGGCGNNVVELGEACDDGNTVNGDYCNSTCSKITTVCGDGKKDATEECDDGNKVDTDGCSNACTINACGNNRVDPGETCEPPNTAICGATCQARDCFCGDGFRCSVEACDDGNTINGDGCSSTCTVELDPCTTCERATGCAAKISACSSRTGVTVATFPGGPAVGTPQSKLCGDLIACADKIQLLPGTVAPGGTMARCSKGSLASGEGCYCGSASVTACVGGSANGVCKSQAEAAAETQDPSIIASGWSDTGAGLALGFGGDYIRCTLQKCKTQCNLQ